MPIHQLQMVSFLLVWMGARHSNAVADRVDGPRMVDPRQIQTLVPLQGATMIPAGIFCVFACNCVRYACHPTPPTTHNLNAEQPLLFSKGKMPGNAARR